MSAFDNLRRFFTPTDFAVGVPTSPFVVIDKARAVKSMRLDELGTQHGKQNQPPPDSEVMDSVEMEIVSQIGDQLTQAHTEASNQLRVYSTRLAELALLRELSSVSTAGTQALGDFSAVVIDRRGGLALAKQAIVESYQDLAGFKRIHGLARPAHRGIQPVYAWSIVAFSWLLESIANTAFLRVNDDHGLLGGFVAALIVAAVNVFLSALVGRTVWPYLLHRRVVPRLLAAMGTIVWLCVIFAWNLLAGHFRDAKASQLDSPEQAAIGLLQANLLQFDSIYSYGLLTAGLAFAFVSAMAAFRANDPYPGYGAIYERHEHRCDEYVEEIQDILEQLRETRDSAIAQAAETKSELGKQFRERGQIIASREELRVRFALHQQHLEDAANYLLTRYRDANIKARTDGTPPKHFSQVWRLSRMELPTEDAGSVVESEVLRAQQSLERTIQLIGEAHNNAIQQFENVDMIKESLAHG